MAYKYESAVKRFTAIIAAHDQIMKEKLLAAMNDGKQSHSVKVITTIINKVYGDKNYVYKI